jgi:hypothetical protein
MNPTTTPAPSARRPPSAVTGGSLEDGLLVTLGLLARDPERFEAAALAWHSRLCSSSPGLCFADAEGALESLAALSGSEPAAAAERLAGVCRQCGLDRVAATLDDWVERRAGRSTESGPPR